MFFLNWLWNICHISAHHVHPLIHRNRATESQFTKSHKSRIINKFSPRFRLHEASNGRARSPRTRWQTRCRLWDRPFAERILFLRSSFCSLYACDPWLTSSFLTKLFNLTQAWLHLPHYLRRVWLELLFTRQHPGRLDVLAPDVRILQKKIWIKLPTVIPYHYKIFPLPQSHHHRRPPSRQDAPSWSPSRSATLCPRRASSGWRSARRQSSWRRRWREASR